MWPNENFGILSFISSPRCFSSKTFVTFYFSFKAEKSEYESSTLVSLSWFILWKIFYPIYDAHYSYYIDISEMFGTSGFFIFPGD